MIRLDDMTTIDISRSAFESLLTFSDSLFANKAREVFLVAPSSLRIVLGRFIIDIFYRFKDASFKLPIRTLDGQITFNLLLIGNCELYEIAMGRLLWGK